MAPDDQLGGTLRDVLRRLTSEPLVFVVAIVIILVIAAGMRLADSSWTALLIVVGPLAFLGLATHLIAERSRIEGPDRVEPATDRPLSPFDRGQPLTAGDRGHGSVPRWDPLLNEIVQSLADALPNEDEIIAIARGTPLSLKRIRRSSRADIFWHSVVERARLEGRVDPLLALAASHADEPNLLAAIQRYHESR